MQSIASYSSETWTFCPADSIVPQRKQQSCLPIHSTYLRAHFLKSGIKNWKLVASHPVKIAIKNNRGIGACICSISRYKQEITFISLLLLSFNKGCKYDAVSGIFCLWCPRHNNCHCIFTISALWSILNTAENVYKFAGICKQGKAESNIKPAIFTRKRHKVTWCRI